MKRTDLLTTLRQVEPALSNRDMIPIFGCLCFDGEGTVTAYNGTVAMQTGCDLDLEGAVKGSLVIGWLNASRGADVEVAAATEHDIVLKSGRSKLTAPLLPTDSFVFTPPTDKPVAIAKELDGFLSALGSVLISLGTDPTHPYFLGATVSFSGDGYECLTCDNFSASRVTQAFPTPKGLRDSAICLPAQFCDLLVGLSKRSAPTKLLAGAGWVECQFASGLTLFSLTVSETGLDQRQELFADTFEASQDGWVPVPKGMDRCIERALVPLASSREKTTNLRVTGGKLRFSTRTDIGEAHDLLKLANHADVSVDVDPNSILKGLSLVDEMQITTGGALFRNTDSGFSYMIATQHEA